MAVFWVLALMATINLELNAQLRVVVQDARSVGVPGALVELWSPLAVIATRRTSAEGVVDFAAAEVDASTSLHVRRVGFRPASVRLVRAVRSIRVSLDLLAAALPEVIVKESARGCPARDQPRARELWEAARRGYALVRGAGRYSWLRNVSGTVWSSQFDTDSDLPENSGWRAYSADGLSGLRRAASLRRYRYQMSAQHTSEDFGVWGYLPLYAEFAEHFADSTFGAHHALLIEHEGADGTVTVRFCTDSRSAGGLDGLLRLTADGEFADATWRFVNGGRDAEAAGGEIVFAPRASPGSVGPLLAASGTFWRRLPSGAYWRRHQAYTKWELLPDTAVRP